MIKARRLSELKDLLEGEISGWWEALARARAALAEATERYDELLTQAILMDFRADLAQKNAIDTLYRSGEHEDTAAALSAESQELENQSFKVVSNFEELRYRASEIWYRLGAVERQRDELRDELVALRAQREKVQGPPQRELDGRIAAREHDLKLAERAHRQIHDEYERESAKKNRLWDEVERIWARSAEMSLTMAEKKMQAKKVRIESEGLFAQAEERKQRAKKLREEAESASRTKEAAAGEVAQLYRQAREKLGCAVGDEFLYFRERDKSDRAFAVGLVDDSQTFNIEVKKLAIYSVDRSRGVSFLEPAVEQAASAEEGDRRFEDYLLTGRKGERKPPLAS